MNLKKQFIVFLIVFLIACGTTGKDFNSGFVKNINNGETTKNELLQEIGEPFRKGVENGLEMWVYEYNKYSSVGEDFSKSLIILFDEQGVVKAYNFSSNFQDERAR